MPPELDEEIHEAQNHVFSLQQFKNSSGYQEFRDLVLGLLSKKLDLLLSSQGEEVFRCQGDVRTMMELVTVVDDEISVSEQYARQLAESREEAVRAGAIARQRLDERLARQAYQSQDLGA